jgi:hypothetical protein
LQPGTLAVLRPSPRIVAEAIAGETPEESMEAIVSSDYRQRMKGAAPAVEGPPLDHAWSGSVHVDAVVTA